jgi:hypothetical protein
MFVRTFYGYPVEAEELMELVVKRLRTDSPAEIATALGLDPYRAGKTVGRWLSGESKPEYDSTILLLRTVGLLREKPGKIVPADVLNRAEPLLQRAQEALEELGTLLGHAPSPQAPRRTAQGGK